MALIDPAALAALPGVDPYGPDLEQAADDDYVAFFNDVSFALPEKFFGPDGPFNPSDKEFQENIAPLPKRLEALLKRTCDLRLFVFVAKLAMIKRDLGEFASSLTAMAALLDAHWSGVHPRALEDSYSPRTRALEELTQPVVAFSLQFAPMCRDRRRGDISLRSKIAPAKEGEPPLTDAQIVQALQAADPEHVAEKRALLERSQDALARIRATSARHTKGNEVPNFGKLQENLAEILKLFDAAFPKVGAEPEASSEDASRAPTSTRAAIRRAAEARAALDCAIDYFARLEPSSPALPLVSQARQLCGKTFIEALAALIPSYVSQATFPIGGRHYFSLSVPELAAATPDCSAYFAAGEGDLDEESPACPEAPPIAAIDVSPQPPTNDAFALSEATTGDLEDGGAAEAALIEDEASGANPVFAQGEIFSPPDLRQAAEEPRGSRSRREFEASTRGQALTLLGEIATYFRAAEPASPIPWLIDRACALAEQDFLSVLRSVLPRHALSEVESD
jgi:type VI secretion system protein ImpA